MIHYYICCFSRILLACLSSSAYLLALNERTPSQKQFYIVLNVFLCSQKFVVNRASRALHAVHVKGPKSLVVHRARTPTLPPSSKVRLTEQAARYLMAGLRQV